MSYNSSWPDLAAFRAGKPRKRARGLVVTVRGIEYYDGKNPHPKRKPGKVIEVVVKDGVYTLHPRHDRKPKATRVRAEKEAAPIDVFVVPEASIQVRNTDGDVVAVGRSHATTATQGKVRPSYASRKAAMVARRGY